ncbi:MAG: phospholipid methyltransferase [Cardiobacteriaceae bacterium]|nr:phospholipid methyltransferase [Cardiobacteriaceae bacterium]
MSRRKITLLVRETAGFSYEFLRHPKGIGSLIPSSRELARAMSAVAREHGDRDALVIEAGAGTGAITRELVGRYPTERLIINELNPRLAARLQRDFDGSDVRAGRIEQLDIWQDTRPKIIVSSLPFRSLPPRIALTIKNVFAEVLREDARNILIQFTYGRKAPIPRIPADIHAQRVAHAWRNIPPAHVWLYRAGH